MNHRPCTSISGFMDKKACKVTCRSVDSKHSFICIQNVEEIPFGSVPIANASCTGLLGCFKGKIKSKGEKNRNSRQLSLRPPKIWGSPSTIRTRLPFSVPT